MFTYAIKWKGLEESGIGLFSKVVEHVANFFLNKTKKKIFFIYLFGIFKEIPTEEINQTG